MAGISNLTPFRGISADVGTVFEQGFLLGEGKPVFGYTSEMAHYQDRVTPDGLFIEPFEMSDNLMIEGATMRFAPGIVRVEATDGDPGAALEASEACVELAASHLHGEGQVQTHLIGSSPAHTVGTRGRITGNPPQATE